MIEVRGNLVRKRGTPSLLSIEFVKTQKARVIGDQCGLFYVPRVIDFDERSGILDLELLPRVRTLHELAVTRDSRIPELMYKAGSALAIVHDHLRLDDESTHPLPREMMTHDNDCAFIHGDFTGGNIVLDEESGRLVILDWSVTPLLGRSATFGPRYFDLVWFVYYWFLARPWTCVSRWNSGAMGDEFLRGYCSNSSFSFSGSAFLQYRKRLEWLWTRDRQRYVRRRPRYRRIPYRLYHHWLDVRSRGYIPPKPLDDDRHGAQGVRGDS
ncbi:MAG: hypothetical protein O7D94_05720 [Planctomycetota bacterium]|nr:hypothetical protein [Planctomycetota bacterium]